MNIEHLSDAANLASGLNIELEGLIGEGMGAHMLGMDLEKLMEYEKVAGEMVQFLRNLEEEYGAA